MAFATFIRGFEANFVGRFLAFYEDYRESRQRYSAYKQTVRELNALSDHDLSDLGISRYSIEQIAMDAAYGR